MSGEERYSIKDGEGQILSHTVTIPDKAAADLVPLNETLPPNLVLLPVSQTTIFPGMIVPLILPEGKLGDTIDKVVQDTGYLGIVLAKNPVQEKVARGPSTTITGLPAEGVAGVSSEKGPMEFFTYGVAARVLKRINLPDNQVSVLLSGLQRFELNRVISRSPHLTAAVCYLPDDIVQDNEMEALLRSAIGQFKQLSKDNPLISEEVKVALVNVDGPSKLADLMASVLVRDVTNYQDFLAAADVKVRLQHLLLLLKKENDVQAVQRRIHDEINQKVADAQREYYLHEQLKAIQKELGGYTDERNRLLTKFKERLEVLTLRDEAKKRIDEELEKFQGLSDQSAEYSVSINYLDWVTALPWGVRSKEFYDLKKARDVLEADHYGLKDVKERILEFLAVRKLKRSSEGTILCFVGPPGTGKTSLGKSIAEALRRKFFRFSVGGMRDEAEIKGHRRTYVGAMPGKVIQGLKRVEVQNPVFLIDEIDKIGTGWAAGGDPASALLELLDPEQNKEFLDHFVDIPFDTSEVFFITTANTTDTIPRPLLDRMEIIPLHGYTDTEKFQIAKRHLIPKQLKKHGLKTTQVRIADVGLRHIISQYARESGVRALEKFIARICRKVAYKVAMQGTRKKILIDKPKKIEEFLGMPPFSPEVSPRKASGVATGLAWTQFGGEVLYVESKAVKGKGGIRLTGSLGDVMQESANIAYTYIRDRAEPLKIGPDYFDSHLLHIHVPSGATPKDGPSAGITIAASLYSLLTGKKIKPGLAMTGELTLTGQVLPVGGVKEKLLAAKRSKLKKILLPSHNMKDLKEIEPDVVKGLKVVPVETMQSCLEELF